MADEKVKARLSQYRRQKNMAEQLDRQISELQKRLEENGTRQIRGRPKKQEPADELRRRIKETEERRDRFERRARKARPIVQAYIDTVTSIRHNELLTGIYIDRKSVEEIAERQGYSTRQMWRIYKEAHKMVELNACQKDVSRF